MKELSIEEKAKAYDETLDRARKEYKTHESFKGFREILVHIFPELAVSEDEKIREKLLSSFKDIMTDADKDELWYGLPYNDIIAWLEKQGEKTPDKIVEKARTEKQRVLLTETDGNASIDWDCRSLDDVKTLLKCGLEFIRTIEANKQTLTDSRFGGCSFRVPIRYDKGIKQDEQRSTDKVESKFKVGDIISNGISEVKIVSIGKDNYTVTNGEIENHSHAGNWVVYFKDQDKWKLVEQKSSWSEEDERMYRGLHNLIYSTPYCDSRKELSDWFESIKDRVQLKKEWSEEDEKYSSYICAALDAYYRLREEKNNTSGQEKLDAAVEWIGNRLKSLKPKEFNPVIEHRQKLDNIIDTAERHLLLSREDREYLKKLRDTTYDKIWTEEDDKFFEELHKEFEKGYEDASIEQLKDIYSRQLQWLESIKSRLTI